MKFLIFLFFLLITSIVVKADGSHVHNYILKIDSLPQNLGFGDHLKLLLSIRRLKPVPINGSRIVPYVGYESYIINVSKIKKGMKFDSLVDSLKLALLDFAFNKNIPKNKLLLFSGDQKNVNSYPDNLIISIRLVDSIVLIKVPELSMQRKAGLIKFLTGWEGYVDIDNTSHTIFFGLTVPIKEYSKRGMNELSKSLAALSYCWLLEKEDAKKWTVGVQFEKEKKRVWPVHPIYTYVGGNKDDDELSFDEVLQTQLEKR